MKYEEIKTVAESIGMPTEMKHRIAENCKKKLNDKTEENIMKNNKNYSFLRKPAAVAAVLAICLSLAVTALASTGTLRGFLKDITKGGAVVGQSYEQATDEIDVTVDVDNDILTARVLFADPLMFPYAECEKLSLGEYSIVDADGKEVIKNALSEACTVTDGKAEISIDLSGISDGSYKLKVNSFICEKKADRPLTVNGSWEISFTK